MRDATRDEMLDVIKSNNTINEDDVFDMEEAIYWFANDYHGGQGSDLYSALCASPFRPGAASNLEPGSMAERYYDDLCHEFTEER